MGVFKWLRRDRVSITSRQTVDENVQDVSTADRPQDIGTIRTEEYKRSLAEFQARRLSGASNRNAFHTPDNRPKKKSARHSLPVSCTKCNNDIADTSFNYEKTSERNYQKAKSRRNSEERLPNIQFLFSNQQVFMPGNIFTRTSFSEVQRSKKSSLSSLRSQDLTLTRQQIDFDVEDGTPESPPLYFKNNCLPFEVSDFLDASPSKDDSISELKNYRYKIKRTEVADDGGEKISPSRSGCDDKLKEVMDELRDFDEWADEQLKMQSINTSKSEETSKCDISYYGLPLLSSSSISILETDDKIWEKGHSGIIPVHVKKLGNVTLDQVKKRQCVEVNILRKYRHPNIMLLMGITYDINKMVRLICERCVATLHTILHIQSNILSVQMAVSYASDIASALVYLHMQGYIHTDVNSTNIMVTHCGVAKLADLRTCVKYTNGSPFKKSSPRRVHDKEVPYVSLDDGQFSSSDCNQLLSASDSNVIMRSTMVAKAYQEYAHSTTYRWHPPELFQPDDAGLVYPCSKTDVYAVCLVLWECCNAAVPWQTLSYEKLSQLYLMWKTGIRLAQDGSYPGCLLALMQSGLKLDREKRCNLKSLAESLLDVKSKLSEMEDILIPEKQNQKRSEFSSVTWETNSMSDVDVRVLSPKPLSSHMAVVHRSTSENSSRQDDDTSLNEGLYEVKNSSGSSSNEEDVKVRYELPERKYSSDYSTPMVKKKVTLREIGTPGVSLHKSDSTEYCSIFSPENRNFDLTDDTRDVDNENANAKLSRSFTPKSYKSLEIKIPVVENLDDIKCMKTKDKSDSCESTYNFNIRDYSLPTTPIARSNKLRKNAWLSGDIKRTKEVELKIIEDGDREEPLCAKSAPDVAINTDEKEMNVEDSGPEISSTQSPQSTNLEFETFCEPKRNAPSVEHCAFESSTLERERSHSWSFKYPLERAEFSTSRITEEVLNNVNVKPLVAIHEKWISEAGRKSEKSWLADEYRRTGPSVKPASHSVDLQQTSVPPNKRTKYFRNNVSMSPTLSHVNRNGSQSEQFTSTRDKIARSMSFTCKDPDRNEFNIWTKERAKCMANLKKFNETTSSVGKEDEKVKSKDLRADTTANAPTVTSSLDDFVKQLIKKEFYQLLNQTSDENCDDEELIKRGTKNVLNALAEDKIKIDADSVKSFSTVKIKGNNKPLIQITFSKSGENQLQVLDSCVNVTICDNGATKNCEEEHYESKEDLKSNALKRCQAFSSIQEAQSTEDLYIDDDLSTHMEENFGGNMKLIPLHGSLHEILCEKADDCCLIKVKQENGCDKMFFMTENADSTSKDAIDGTQNNGKFRDKVVFKRSISLIEERFERIYPKDKKEKQSAGRVRSKEFIDTKNPMTHKSRFNIDKGQARVKKDSKACMPPKHMNEHLNKPNSNEKLVNIEHMMSYQDSSSDESTKSFDDFEEMEKRVEEDMAGLNTSANYCGALEKISEENLSVVNEDIVDKASSNADMSDYGDGIIRAELRKTRSCDMLQ